MYLNKAEAPHQRLGYRRHLDLRIKLGGLDKVGRGWEGGYDKGYGGGYEHLGSDRDSSQELSPR